MPVSTNLIVWHSYKRAVDGLREIMEKCCVYEKFNFESSKSSVNAMLFLKIQYLVTLVINSLIFNEVNMYLSRRLSDCFNTTLR